MTFLPGRLPPVTEMARALRRRDASYDGVFFAGVRTTGIFCRPSCPARKPLPRNVTYFGSVRDAVFAGFRPCKRCRPLEVRGSHPPWVSGLLARLDGEPSLRIRNQDLRAAGVHPDRARRYFQRHYGMTFHAFARGYRLRRAFEQLKRGTELDEVAMSHGFESHSGFRDAFSRALGHPPGQSRSAECVTVTWLESPVGPLIAGATSEGIGLLEFSDRRMLETQFETVRRRLGPLLPGTHPLLEQLRAELNEYFAGTRRSFSVPLVYPGTPFQVKVWEALCRIPYGETVSYEQLSWAVGRPGAQRAVGHANGQNPIAIVIPCHRVVNKNGKLGGYGGGLWRKQLLLDLERGEPGLGLSAQTAPPAYGG
ncbi:MAG TPA: methylated-DNA--[protein]-cysteine S-methyltransferase [Gemmatimonadales bacterium]|nr:methylated-DNA--[protein]-cysteine S-methyltransferase [Gemmatimonadales bacterium]